MPSTAARSRAPFLVTIASLVLAVACGGAAGTAPAGSSGDAATNGGGSGTAGNDAAGDYADPAVLAAAIEGLAELGSFSYETTIGVRNLGEDLTYTIAGVEHPAAGNRAFHASRNDGVEWAAVTVDGEFFADIGRGLEPLDDREDTLASTDPNWIANVAPPSLDRYWEDFVVVGDETIDGRAVRHYALDEAGVENILQSFDGDYETFAVDMWVDAADGYLVRIAFARQPFPTSGFSPLREFRFELSDVGCECPISAPS